MPATCGRIRYVPVFHCNLNLIQLFLTHLAHVFNLNHCMPVNGFVPSSLERLILTANLISLIGSFDLVTDIMVGGSCNI